MIINSTQNSQDMLANVVTACAAANKLITRLETADIKWLLNPVNGRRSLRFSVRSWSAGSEKYPSYAIEDADGTHYHLGRYNSGEHPIFLYAATLDSFLDLVEAVHKLLDDPEDVYIS